MNDVTQREKGCGGGARVEREEESGGFGREAAGAGGGGGGEGGVFWETSASSRRPCWIGWGPPEQFPLRSDVAVETTPAVREGEGQS